MLVGKFHRVYEKEGEGSGPGHPKPDPANPGAPAPVATPPAPVETKDATSEVAKAYEKLRTTENELKEVKKDAAKVPTLQQENDQLKSENATLKKAQAENDASTVITSKARELNFNRPDRAMQALRAYTDVDPLTLTDETKVEKALRDLATAEGHLVGQVPPSGGPVLNAGEPVGGNAAVNRAIRAAAGR